MSCSRTRTILVHGIAQIPASGQIAARSVEKYGKRANRSASMRRRALQKISTHLAPNATLLSDEHPRYGTEIKGILPGVCHIQFPSKRGSLTGQGELKRIGYDPLFGINHTLAMMRDNIKRLTRRTWCTTKKTSALDDVIAIYVNYHNTRLV